tara:strand:+ start:1413 stop:1538 length:126 start_codon:yes stop_codon:yes gene_type:complete
MKSLYGGPKEDMSNDSTSNVALENEQINSPGFKSKHLVICK